MGRTLSTTSHLFLVLLLAIASVLGIAPAAQAAEQADLQVNLTGPAQSSPNVDFTYTIAVSNLGPSAADGSRVDFTAPAGATGVTVTCGSPTAGAVCGTFTVANGRALGTLTKFPGNGGAVITVRGTFGAGSSATATATITAPTGVTELDPSSNTSTQNTALAQAQVNTTTTVSPTTVASGGTVTVTTTFENVGPVAVENFDLRGLFEGTSGPADGASYSFEGTTECATSSEIPCPADSLGKVSITGDNRARMPFDGAKVDLAPGQKIVFSTTLTVERSCDLNRSSRAGTVTSQFYPRQQATSTGAPYEVQGNSYSSAEFFVTGGGSLCPRPLILSKTVDQPSAPSGEERTFTIAVENPNDTPASVGSLVDTLIHSGYVGFTATGGVSCAAESSAPCPPGVTGTAVTADGFAVEDVQLPAGSRLVLSIPMRLGATCRAGGTGVNSVNANNIRVGEQPLSGESTLVDYVIADLPDCGEGVLDITADRTSPEVVYSGQDTVDRVVITNNSNTAVTEAVLGVSPGSRPQGFSYFLPRDVTCVPGESSGDCSTFQSALGGGYTFALGPGESLVLIASAPVQLDGVCPSGEPGSYTTSYTLRAGSGYWADDTEQRVGCNDVAAETAVPTLTPQAGSAFPVTATVSNEGGVARDTKFSMVLPANGYVFDPAAGDTITCEVVTKTSTQNVTCPEFFFDPATRAVTGVIPVLGTGDSVRIRVNGSAGVVEGRSYPITTTVAASGDTVPGSNTSVVNFGVANTLVPTFGEVTVNLPAGASLDQDLVFPAQMVCKSSGTTDAEVRVAAGSTTGRVSLDETVWRNDDCVVTFQRPEAPAGFEWDGDFSENPVNLSAVQAGATARTAVSLRAVVPVPSPSVTEEPSPEPTTPGPSPTEEPSPEPTTPGPSPTEEPSPKPTSPVPSPTEEPSPEPTSPVPSPSVTEEPSPEPTTPGPSPTEEPSPEPTSPEPTVEPSEPVPSSSVTDEPSPEPSPTGKPSSEPTSPAPGDPSPTDPAPDSPVVPGTPGAGPVDGAAGPGGPGSTPSSGAGGVDVKTGFDRVVSDSRTWWVVAALVVLGGAAGVSAAMLRRRSRGR